MRRRYRKNPIDEDLILFGLLGVGAYVAYTYLFSSGGALTSSGAVPSAIGGFIWSLFNEQYTPGTYFTVQLPDGTCTAINSSLVNQSGQFTIPSSGGSMVPSDIAANYAGNTYQLGAQFSGSCGGGGGGYACTQVS